MLNKEQIKELRKSFRADQIKWKIQTQPKDKTKLEGWGVVVSYLDARDISERLDVATEGQWADDYNLFGKALECSLTVCGVTRKDVGEAESAKELYSDAFKRAAVKFGVGAFLYRMPGVMAKLTRKDALKPWALGDEARASLRAIASAVADGQAPAARYAGLMLLSDYQAPEAMPGPAPEQAQEGQQEEASPDTAPPEIGAERAAKLHRALGAILKETRHAKMTHEAFAATILSREVEGLSGLSASDAAQVYHAAENEQQQAMKAS